MNRKTCHLLIIGLCAASFTLASGCGRYLTQYSPPTIISTNPTLEAVEISSGEVLWLKFSKSMNESDMDINTFLGKIKIASDMSAVPTTEPLLTPEAVWSSNNTVLTVNNVFLISADANGRVHILSSREAFQDKNGLFLPENTDLWNYTLQ